MIIDDLEFINHYDQSDSNDLPVIQGGASASVWVNTSTSDSSVSANASANASGDISAAYAGTNSTLITGGIPQLGIGYVAGYATGYGAAYAVDRYSGYVSETSTSISIV